MMIIGFEDYKVMCVIGTEAYERSQEQEIFIDLKVRFDSSQSIKEDNLSHGIDYIKLSKICREIAVKGKYRLIETLAEAILSHIKQTFSIVWGWVKIKKTSAIPSARWSFAELEIN